MRFMLVDDDEAIRSMLSEIIEDYDLGKVACEAENGLAVDSQLLTLKEIDILIIDMLMPLRDGIQTVKNIKDSFHGKIIMLSQVEDKELVGNAYSLGVDYYITKPINRNEVVSVIRSVSEHLRLKALIHNIESNLHTALRPAQETPRRQSQAASPKQRLPSSAMEKSSSAIWASAAKKDRRIFWTFYNFYKIIRWKHQTISLR